MLSSFIIFLVVLLIAMLLSYIAGKLTLAGTLTGGVVAIAIYMSTGWIGISMLAVFSRCLF